MSNAIQINVRKRGTSACVEPNYRIEVVDGMRAIVALERIADALETKPKQYTQEDNTEEVYSYCPICGSDLHTTTVDIGFTRDSTLENRAYETQTIKYCECGFVKNVGVK